MSHDAVWAILCGPSYYVGHHAVWAIRHDHVVWAILCGPWRQAVWAGRVWMALMTPAAQLAMLLLPWSHYWQSLLAAVTTGSHCRQRDCSFDCGNLTMDLAENGVCAHSYRQPLLPLLHAYTVSLRPPRPRHHTPHASILHARRVPWNTYS